MSNAAFRKMEIGYMTRSEPEEPSLVFLVASKARALIKAGEDVQLPAGHDVATLDAIIQNTSVRYQDVRVSVDQAREIAEIGRQLLKKFRGKLSNAEAADISKMLQVIDS